MAETLIVGGGISGLTCAYLLMKAGVDVELLEAGDHVGGCIASLRQDGYLLEAGPNSLRIENQETLDVIAEAGLLPRLQPASASAKHRFILRDGKAIPTPASLAGFLTTPLFSRNAKLRLLKEPLIKRGTAPDESVYSFFSRRMGQEIADYAVSPFVNGIYAGDPAKLSIRSAFPKLWEMEQHNGSLTRGAFSGGKTPNTLPRSRRGIASFPDGLSELTDAMYKALGTRVRTNTKVDSIEGMAGSYTLTANGKTISAKRVVIATPAYIASQLVQPFSIEASVGLRSIPYPPVTVVYLGFDASQCSGVPEGFGLLIPQSEHRDILGCIFTSSIFPDRAPANKKLLTVLIGGALAPELARSEDAKIYSSAVSALHSIFGVTGEPEFQALRKWERAIPQYDIGHHDRMTQLDNLERAQKGLYLLANYRGGIAIGACIRNATQLAARLVLESA
jgi:oxygen-dependent protoporphyrinogen oxidase